ncbi:ATP-dependent helicase [Candidatus Laterigemmans baculatus]|uniref:ATP-dependent helicase n=1 Tax=Candidatus Laterigemmans baculatus TaxID=2770505 RepID=UPI0013DBA024|nr:UvrD-helicase domain-containing protein [Candidatus Laterigemmans baculatus]
MDAILRDLTPAQREAVTHVDGPLLILAGPGSGKTRVVTHRIAHMIGHGIPAWQITALTFTNKAAEEMRGRVERLAPGQPVWMGTFHRFCARLLRRYASLVGLNENYSIYDTTDAKQAMRRAIEAAKVNTSHTSPEQIAAVISRFKNRLVLPEMLEDQALRAADHVAARVYPVYQQQLLTANAVDFDDLLLHVARMLRDNHELRAELDSRHRYILVDEYQDTNLAQYAIVRALSVDYPNLSVTGDPDQSIYGWRGADINNILDFEKDYPSVLTVRLEENYRSTPEILHVADTLIRHNTRRKAKELFTHNPSGEPVTLRSYNDGYEEADDIAEQIAAGVDAGRFRPRDVAVFCRMNALTRSLEHAFRARGVPYQIVNGVEFYQRKEIKDLLAYLHLINNPAHDVALQRVINTPARGIGAKTIERLRQHADSHRIPLLDAAREAGLIGSLAPRSAAKVAAFVALYDRLCLKATEPLETLLRYLLQETGYQEHLEKTAVDDSDNNPLANVDELISAAVEFDQQFPEEAPLEAFLEQVALVSDTDAWQESNDRVTLMTLHAAKGLEFPRVYIIAVENDLLPHARSQDDPSQLEEERRLLFVGITRAEQHLQLSYARRRTMRGQLRPAAPSHFLIELPRATMRMTETPDPAEFYTGGSDADPYADEAGYPDAWDLPAEEARPSAIDDDDLCQLPDDERGMVRESSPAGPPAGMTTAADLLSRQRENSLAVGFFRNGMAVMHPEYGEGRIVDLTGRGPKRTAKVVFAEGYTQTFRLAFAPLTPAE